MPRYFFDTADGERVCDPDGIELADVREARLYAIRYAGECIADESAQLSEHRDFRVEVRNRDGLHLFTVTTFVTDGPAGAPACVGGASEAGPGASAGG